MSFRKSVLDKAASVIFPFDVQVSRQRARVRIILFKSPFLGGLRNMKLQIEKTGMAGSTEH